jgi:hypothetical protein
MQSGAGISTEATRSNGGDISFSIQHLMYLLHSSIVTTVKGTEGEGGGNGGNISIDPQFLVLNHSLIQANAAGGHGGNITITAGEFIPSFDSKVEASSRTGINGTITISAPADTVTAALANLAARFRAPPVLDQINCASVAERVGISGVTQGSRGTWPEDGTGMQVARYFAAGTLANIGPTESQAEVASPASRPPPELALLDNGAERTACR